MTNHNPTLVMSVTFTSPDETSLFLEEFSKVMPTLATVGIALSSFRVDSDAYRQLQAFMLSYGYQEASSSTTTETIWVQS